MAYCNNCGTKLPDGAKFCHECGSAVVRIKEEESSVDVGPGEGKIIILREQDFNTGAFSCTVSVDGGEPLMVNDGGEVIVDVQDGEHEVVVRPMVGKEQVFNVTVPTNGVETVIFSLGARKPQPKIIESSPVSKPADADNTIKCPKCGGEVNFQTVTESSELGCGSFVGVIVFALLACLISWVVGIIVFVIGLILVTKGSNETVTYAVCQKCGYRFRKQRM